MDELKKSPFLLGLLITTVVLTLLLVALGVMQKGKYTENKTKYQKLSKSLSSMESMRGYPTKKTVDDYRDSLTAYKGRFESLKETLEKTTVSEFQNKSSGAFAADLAKEQSAVKEIFQKENILLPDEWNLGFEKYSSSPAPANFTGLLGYQLDAMSWLHKEIAAVPTRKILNISRLAVEETVNADGQSSVNKLPVELTFEIKEAGLRDLLNTLGSSEEFFFTIESLKLVNKPVDSKKSKKKKKRIIKRKDFSQKDLDAPDAKLLDQVYGAETLNVFLSLNLVYFNANIELPEIK